MPFEINREDLAWVAGIIDGEGCISIHRPQGRIYPRLTIGQTGKASEPPEMLTRLVRIFPWGKIYRARDSRKLGQHKPSWQFEANGFWKTQAIVAMVWEWLTPEKKEAAIKSLSNFKENRYIRPDLCPYGHEYTGRADNKGRRCKECNAARERKRRAISFS